jgi:RNA polymerase sigma-70 factor (ECF subfamily)
MKITGDLLNELERWARSNVSWSANDGWDLVQEAVVRAILRRGRFPPDSDIRPWLKVVMRNLAVDEYRRRRQQVVLDEEVIPSETDEGQPRWAYVSMTDVLRAMNRLPPGQRKVLRMHALERLSYGEIAARLAMPIGTVGTRIMRARRYLREVFISFEPQDASCAMAGTPRPDRPGVAQKKPRRERRGSHARPSLRG